MKIDYTKMTRKELIQEIEDRQKHLMKMKQVITKLIEKAFQISATQKKHED